MARNLSYLKNGWYFTVRPPRSDKDVFMSMAKMQVDGDFKTDSPIFEPAPNGLYFNFGFTIQQALEIIEEEVFSIKQEPKESRLKTWLKRSFR